MATHPPAKPASALTVTVGTGAVTIGKSYVRGRALLRATAATGRFLDLHPTEAELADIIDAAAARREAMRREREALELAAAAAAAGGAA